MGLIDYQRLTYFGQPVFIEAELNVLHELHTLIETSYEIIPSTYSPQALKVCVAWHQLTALAKNALALFMVRGRHCEDKLMPFLDDSFESK